MLAQPPAQVGDTEVGDGVGGGGGGVGDGVGVGEGVGTGGGGGGEPVSVSAMTVAAPPSSNAAITAVSSPSCPWALVVGEATRAADGETATELLLARVLAMAAIELGIRAKADAPSKIVRSFILPPTWQCPS